ncbi:MAG: phosphomethylpyrimidine synthase ThiC [Coriobacteriales bacterium]|nr:phosphomethylpyrimidine synthase ThiC [Coriobacteriales bacterium]
MELLRTRAIKGEITELMEKAALQEGVEPEFIRKGLAAGTIVLLGSNVNSTADPLAVGTGLTTKVSASVGLYGSDATIAGEFEKIAVAVEAGTDAIMDLSVSGDIDGMRAQALAASKKPVGTLPLYQALAQAKQKHGSSLDMTTYELFEVITRQAQSGVDFIALHCGTTMDVIERAQREGRIDPLVSYGGAHLIGWMLHNKKENPMFEHFDRVLEIAAEYDVTLSFADGMRPGALADSMDGAQVHELVVLGELVGRARAANVQVMVKGPGHVPLEQIKPTIALQKALCHNAPYFVFGPLVTDSAVGYDHISAAIGGAISAWSGAEFLCYVTPAEHMGLPDARQVRDGVIAARIAAHAGDLAKELPSAVKWDNDLSEARKELDWKRQIELAIDPPTAERIWKERSGDFSSKCTMCGPYCAMEIISDYLNIEIVEAC